MSLAQRKFTNVHVWDPAREIGEVGGKNDSFLDLSRIVDNWGVLVIMTGKAIALNLMSVTGELNGKEGLPPEEKEREAAD